MKRYIISDSIISKLKSSISKDGRLMQSKFYKSLNESEIVYLNSIQSELGVKFDCVYLRDHLINNEFIPKVCSTCGKIITDKKKKHCNHICANNDPIIKNTIIQNRNDTILKKYGVNNPFQSDEIKQKIKKKNLEKYGVENPTQCQEIQDKISKTMVERYGVNRFSQTKEWKETVPLMYKNGEIDLNVKLDKCRKTCLERYNCENVTQSKLVRDKSVATIRTKFYKQFLDHIKDRDIICDASIDQFADTNYSVQLKCNRCGFSWAENAPTCRTVCPNCTVDKSISECEREILQFIKGLYNGEIITNSHQIIKPLELDIYIPDKKLAIEYNGNYWHCDTAHDKLYHYTKSKMCSDIGIRLIHIFEYDWSYNRTKVEQLIKSSLGIYSTKIYARQCEVKTIPSHLYHEFLEANHLQGKINSSIRLGLFYSSDLVAVAGFGKSRFSADSNFELHRFCVKSGMCIVGGFSKLICNSGVKSFFSYIDYSKFDGHSYFACGFKFDSITPPNYVYVKYNQCLSRYQCQKHKLKSLLGANYDETKTEYENMTNAGYLRIYDSGNIKVVYNA